MVSKQEVDRLRKKVLRLEDAIKRYEDMQDRQGEVITAENPVTGEEHELGTVRKADVETALSDAESELADVKSIIDTSDLSNIEE